MGDDIWAEIEGFSNYSVNIYGDIINNNKLGGRPLKPNNNGRNYMKVTLSQDGAFQQRFIHHIVAEAFLDDYHPSLQIEWIDGNTRNNAASNLRIRNPPLAIVSDFPPARGPSVRIVETGQIFMSARTCAKYIGGDFSSVYKCLRDPSLTHRGYTFKYVGDV